MKPYSLATFAVGVWQCPQKRMRVDVPQTVGRLRGAENERRFNRYGMALIGLVTNGDYGIVIVTAHQVIEDIPGETISVRLNRKDGSSDTRKVVKISVITFKDLAIDLCFAGYH